MTDEQYQRFKQICDKRGITLSPNPGPLVLMDPNVVEKAYRDACRFSNRAALLGAAIAGLTSLPLLLLHVPSLIILSWMVCCGALFNRQACKWYIRRNNKRHL